MITLPIFQNNEIVGYLYNVKDEVFIKFSPESNISLKELRNMIKGGQFIVLESIQNSIIKKVQIMGFNID